MSPGKGDDAKLSIEIEATDRATEPIRRAQRKTALVGLEIALADMAQLRAGLLREMPDRLGELAERLDVWCRAVMPAIRELRRSDPEEETDPTVCPHCEERHSINLQAMCGRLHDEGGNP